jgi:hypothetical protein
MQYFSCSSGTIAVSIKSVPEHVTLNLCFCVVGSTDHVVHSGGSGARNINTLFCMLGWDRYGFHKKLTETRYAKLLVLHLWDLLVT